MRLLSLFWRKFFNRGQNMYYTLSFFLTIFPSYLPISHPKAKRTLLECSMKERCVIIYFASVFFISLSDHLSSCVSLYIHLSWWFWALALQASIMGRFWIHGICRVVFSDVHHCYNLCHLKRLNPHSFNCLCFHSYMMCFDLYSIFYTSCIMWEKIA